MMARCLFLFSLAAIFGVEAALPPLAQSAREIRSLLSDPHLQTALGSGQQIQNVIKTEKGYLVVTRDSMLLVDVQYGSTNGLAAPIPFQFVFHDVVKIQ